MQPLVECIPNFSEGRRADVIEAIVAVLRDRPGVSLLDVDPNPDHNRTVVTFVGNPIMHHLLLGINPIELGGAPFALATDGPTMFWASEIDLKIHPNARIYVLPCIAGHVGADTAGVILSEAPHEADDMTLIVDVGTNAEIVLGNRKKLLAASSPTGPSSLASIRSISSRRKPAASAGESANVTSDVRISAISLRSLVVTKYRTNPIARVRPTPTWKPGQLSPRTRIAWPSRWPARILSTRS